MSKSIPTSIIIFGASGDLTRRKLIPSLFNLYLKERLPKKFRVFGYSGTSYSDQEFRSRLQSGVDEFATYEFDKSDWDSFAQQLTYQSGNIQDLGCYKSMESHLSSWEDGPANRLFYMATPPVLFPNIIKLLGQTNLVIEDDGWRRPIGIFRRIQIEQQRPLTRMSIGDISRDFHVRRNWREAIGNRHFPFAYLVKRFV